MFAGLDDLDWDALEHAYGPAADVPGQLRDLVSGDDDLVKGTLSTFYSNIYHQGTIYSATVASVPFLAEALDHIAPAHQAEVLILLAHLAQGHGYLDVHQHMSHLGEGLRSGFDDPDATLAAERGIVRDTTLAVFAEWDRFASRLEDADPSVRNAALYLLAVLGQNDASNAPPEDAAQPYLGIRPDRTEQGYWARQVEAAAMQLLETAPDAVTRASARAALLSIGRADHPDLRFDALPEDAAAIERFVVLIAQAQAADAILPDALAPEIARVVREFEALEQAHRSDHWPWQFNPRQWLPSLAARLSDEAVDTVAADLVPMLGMGTHYADHIHLALGRKPPHIPDEPCTLSPGRRILAQGLVDLPETSPYFWIWSPKNGNASAAFKRLGLPRDRMLWHRWLNPRPSWLRSIFGGRP